ncbi:hypothetical protein KA071_00970 [Candidatus Gracilibacteria bacterium]|jgi:hypothetical protein|nr:hypothetical protein [Candidatus Gracilibacteria bacterium]
MDKYPAFDEESRRGMLEISQIDKITGLTHDYLNAFMGFYFHFQHREKGKFFPVTERIPLYHDYIAREKLVGAEVNDRNSESVRRLDEIVGALNLAFFDQQTLTSEEFSISYRQIKAIIQS